MMNGGRESAVMMTVTVDPKVAVVNEYNVSL